MMYEALTVEGLSHPTIAAAITELVVKLQSLGFSRIRTRANFKGTKSRRKRNLDRLSGPGLIHFVPLTIS